MTTEEAENIEFLFNSKPQEDLEEYSGNILFFTTPPRKIPAIHETTPPDSRPKN